MAGRSTASNKRRHLQLTADILSPRRYSPGECIGAVKHRIDPDPKRVSTSYAECFLCNVGRNRDSLVRISMADFFGPGACYTVRRTFGSTAASKER